MAEQEMMEDVETAADITAEEPTPTEAEVEADSTGFDVTPDQIPDLAGKQIGDQMTFAIRKISDDGNTYTLVLTGGEGTPLEAPLSPEEGQAAVANELLGGTGA